MGYKTIFLDGIEYFLVPKKQDIIKEEKSIIATYQPEEIIESVDESIRAKEININVESAKPKISDHRLRYKEQRLNGEDIAKGRGIPINEIKSFRDIEEVEHTVYNGEKLFFGEGLQKG